VSALRVAVVGSDGRMGSTVCEAVEAADDLELVARVDANDSLQDVLDAGADVAVEFTTPDSVKANAAWLLERGVHVVVGATGLTDEDLADLEQRTGPANLFVAPNFAIGAVLLMQLAQQAARHLPHVEITELHHDRKVDAPSGTALRTARLISEARQSTPAVPGPDAHPARGLLVDGIPVHSVRLPGLVASQEVVFGGEGQTLTLRHDSIDRSSFMPGVLLAVRRVATTPGLTVGLEHLL
jgi:4-hydroxy-tetrahydrodipicolinate reductase